MESSTDGRYREIVFDAWIDPKGIHEWMCPGDALSAEATLDVRVGGSFPFRRVAMATPDQVLIRLQFVDLHGMAPR